MPAYSVWKHVFSYPTHMIDISLATGTSPTIERIAPLNSEIITEKYTLL